MSKRSRESEAEESLASGSEAEDERKSQPASSPKKKQPASSKADSKPAKGGLADFTMDEDEEEEAWNAERDEAEEAKELEAQLSGSKPKKRRLQKASEVEQKAKSQSYRSGLLGQ